MGGRRREHARGWGRWGASSEGPGAATWTQGTGALRAECAGHGGGQGRVVGQLGERVRATRVEGLKRLGGSGGFLGTGILSN